MRRLPILAILLPLAAWLLPVATACTNRGEELTKQFESIKRELAELKASQAHNSVVLGDLQNKVLLLDDQVDSQRLALSRISNEGSRSDLPVVKLSRPGHFNEDFEYDDELISVGIREFNETSYVDGSQPEIVPAGSVLPNKPANVPANSKSQGSKKKRNPGLADRPLDLYKTAFEALQAKRHSEAIAGFDSFLELYPNHDYSDNSLYWMGEAYYDMQDYSRALNCFERVVVFYPSGNKVPDSMLKAALCHRHLGDEDSFARTVEKLTDRFPATKAAEIAKTRLHQGQ